MGKHRRSAGPNGPGNALLPGERRERSLIHEAERLRTTLLPRQYLDWCRRQCRAKGGLGSSAVRAVIWKDLLLMQPDGNTAPTVPYLPSSSSSSSNKDATLPTNCQIHVMNCDLQRSLWHLYPNEAQRNEKRLLVKEVLVRALSHRPELQYFQGLHEVIGFFMYCVGPHVPKETLVMMVDQLLAQHLHLYCHKSMKSSESVLYAAHYAIADNQPQLAADLERLDLGPGTHYALPWLITWFAHHLSESSPSVLSRLFDVLLCGCEGDTVNMSAPPAPVSSPSTSSAAALSSSQTAAAKTALALRASARSLASRWLLRGSSGSSLFLNDDNSGDHHGVGKHTRSKHTPQHNATMAGLMTAALVLHHGDEIRRTIADELEAAGGDVGSAFGHVFALMSSLPTRLANENTMEACVGLAVAMADGCERGRRSLLSRQEAYCVRHSLSDVAALARAESASIPHLPTDGPGFHFSARVVRAAVVTAMVGVLAISNFSALME